jgi:hypothetical protein
MLFNDYLPYTIDIYNIKYFDHFFASLFSLRIILVFATFYCFCLSYLSHFNFTV